MELSPHARFARGWSSAKIKKVEILVHLTFELIAQNFYEKVSKLLNDDEDDLF